MIDLDKLSELAKAATPGPWYVDNDCDLMSETALNPPEIQEEEGMYRGIVALPCRTDCPDYAFIAAVNPATVLQLIADIRRLSEIPGDGVITSFSEGKRLVVMLKDSNEKLREEIASLKQKLGVAVEALEFIKGMKFDEDDWDEPGMTAVDIAREALKKIGANSPEIPDSSNVL